MQWLFISFSITRKVAMKKARRELRLEDPDWKQYKKMLQKIEYRLGYNDGQLGRCIQYTSSGYLIGYFDGLRAKK